MRYKNLFLFLFLTAGLIVPLGLSANAIPQGVSVRVYDRDHKDYHNWDDHEQKAYEEFRHDHPKFSVTFSKTSRSQQSEYWKWRHDHPDHD